MTIAILAAIVSSAASAHAQLKTLREGVGFDGVVVGRTTMADIKKKFGKNPTVKKHKTYSTQLIYPGGISFYFCQSDKKQQVFDIELRAPFRGKTARGITLSQSTVQDVERIYGKNRDGGLQYPGVSFFYANNRGRKVITVIDIVEKRGIRQCGGSK
jgi:hypothetical protein